MGGSSGASSSGTPPCATSATRRLGAASQSTSGTRKIAPADARSALGPTGSAQPSESATAAPNASADRMSVPTFPGSATCQRPRTTSRAPVGRSSRLKTPITRGACPSVDTSPRSSGSTFSPATNSSTGTTPAASAASIRSSPSAANRPLSIRCLRAERSFRTSRSFSFWRDSIRLLLSRSRSRPRAPPSRVRRLRQTPVGPRPRCPRATCDRARSRPSSRRP